MSTEVDPDYKAPMKRIPAFDMPKVGIGEPVIFYKNGIIRDDEAVIAFVREIGSRAISVVSLGHIGQEGVMHVDDPHVKEVKELRELGLWDFPPTTKKLRQQVAALQDTVAAMQADLLSLSAANGELFQLLSKLNEPPVAVEASNKKPRA